jgi:hypothetical protein
VRNCLFAFLAAFLAAFALNANALLLTGTERVTASTFIFADLERHIGSAVDADGTVALTRYTADRTECALWTPLGGVRVISPPEAVRCHTRNIADGMLWGVIGYSSDVND